MGLFHCRLGGGNGLRQENIMQRIGRVLCFAMAIAMLTGVTHWFRDMGPMGRDEVAACYAEMVLKTVAAP